MLQRKSHKVLHCRRIRLVWHWCLIKYFGCLSVAVMLTAAALRSPVPTLARAEEEYNEEMHQPSAGGADGGALAERVAAGVVL